MIVAGLAHDEVAFIVLLAGPGVTGAELLIAGVGGYIYCLDPL